MSKTFEMNVAYHIIETHKPLLAQTVFPLQLLEIYEMFSTIMSCKKLETT